MRNRQLTELNLAVVQKDFAWAKGFLQAAVMAEEMYGSSSSHPYNLEDCLLAKVNLLNKKCRIRKRT